MAHYIVTNKERNVFHYPNGAELGWTFISGAMCGCDISKAVVFHTRDAAEANTKYELTEVVEVRLALINENGDSYSMVDLYG